MLDLRDVGAPVRAPVQDALFGVAPAELIRRPSPASVLFLENGGGKSVLIKLIFSVMLPGRRQVVGTTSTRVLEKFVQAGDVAHVLLEWQHIDTGARVVTGKVSEWRGHVVSTDPAKLVDAWYSFRPTSGLTLDSLPLTDGGRLVTLAGFRERFAEASRDEPQLQGVWETGQADWTDHLANLGIDTELFRYQRAMNAGEGEAADAFTFKTDDAFVDFLLRAVVDEQDPRGLAEVVEGYANKLSQRGALRSERDFVAGALERLVPLAGAEEQAVTARRLATQARAGAERFYTAVAVRHAIETDRLALAEGHERDLAELEQHDDREADRLGSVVLELRRLVAGLRLKAAEQEKKVLDDDLVLAKVVLAAWLATETVLGALSASGKAEGLRRLVGEQEQRARPALEARNETARAFARGLLHVATTAGAAASTAQQEADELRRQESTATGERDAQLAEAAGLRERARGLDDRIAEARAAVQEQVKAGLLPDGADVGLEAAIAAEASDAATAELEDAVAERERLAGMAADAETAVHAAQLAAAAATAAAERAAGVADVAVDTARSLSAEDRLAELLGTDAAVLDEDTPELLELLASAVDEAEQEATAVRLADAEDRRALAALGEGGLLPAPRDVTSAVDALAAAGITAWAGWRYLSTIAPAERATVLRRFPHLVDGVVLNNPGQLDHAERVLVAASLLPRSVVAVGTTAAITGGDGARPDGMAFLVPPNPAMFDEDEAQAVRAATADRHRRNELRLAELGTRLAGDRELAGRLRQFQRDYPPGAVDKLVAARDDTAAARESAVAAAGERQADLSSAKAAESEHLRRLPELRATERRLHDRAGKLATLASRVAGVTTWAASSAQATEAADRADAAAMRANERASVLRDVAEARRRLADDHRRTADTCRAELAEVYGGGSVSDADPPPAEPLDALRRAARAAADAYTKVEVGADLRAALEQAEEAESQTRAALEALPADIRARATELITSPDGADPPARAAAVRRSEATVQALEGQVSSTTERIGSLRAQYQHFTHRDRSLEPYGRPTSIEHGEALIAAAQTDTDIARARLEETRKARAQATAAVGQAKGAVDGFNGVLDSMHGSAPIEPDPSVTAFDGDVATARARRTDIRTNLGDAESLLETAVSEVRRAADELAQHATDQRFDAVTSPVRRQMIAVRRDELPGHAAEWERALRPRLRTLEDDLEQIDRHRGNIVTRLTGMVGLALGTLRSAQRLSRLPDGLGDWSGQEFLRVKFADLDDGLLPARIGEVIDEATGQGKDAAASKRDGMSLLLRGVHAAAPKGFHVEMLKPDAVLRTERLRVSEIRDVFSGGQQLTAAIILYCTLAALRANDRGKARQRHSGVLFLDNPIGRASAGYLLELQLAVAHTLGVQLVYTTGLFDAGALSVFPLIIRLRNDADLRAGLKYLSVDSTVRRELAGLGEPDGTGRLSATRVFVRPTSPAST
ncbi:MAG TPA: hypothetical protein VGJ44_07830 [Kribbellaceae bacterium]